MGSSNSRTDNKDVEIRLAKTCATLLLVSGRVVEVRHANRFEQDIAPIIGFTTPELFHREATIEEYLGEHNAKVIEAAMGNGRGPFVVRLFGYEVDSLVCIGHVDRGACCTTPSWILQLLAFRSTVNESGLERCSSSTLHFRCEHCNRFSSDCMTFVPQNEFVALRRREFQEVCMHRVTTARCSSCRAAAPRTADAAKRLCTALSNKDFRRVVDRAAVGCGATVVEAKTEKEFLSLAPACDVAIVDVLFGGRGGFDAVGSLRRVGSKVRVIFVGKTLHFADAATAKGDLYVCYDVEAIPLRALLLGVLG